MLRWAKKPAERYTAPVPSARKRFLEVIRRWFDVAHHKWLKRVVAGEFIDSVVSLSNHPVVSLSNHPVVSLSNQASRVSMNFGIGGGA